MSGQEFSNVIRQTAITATFAAFLLPVSARSETPLTAGVVVEKMPPNELVVYVAGIVEGLAYARFRYDSLKAGHNVETGMACIRNWYYGNPALSIGDAFRRYKDQLPWVVIAVMVKKECGE